MKRWSIHKSNNLSRSEHLSSRKSIISSTLRGSYSSVNSARSKHNETHGTPKKRKLNPDDGANCLLRSTIIIYNCSTNIMKILLLYTLFLIIIKHRSKDLTQILQKKK